VAHLKYPKKSSLTENQTWLKLSNRQGEFNTMVIWYDIINENLNDENMERLFKFGSPKGID